MLSSCQLSQASLPEGYFQHTRENHNNCCSTSGAVTSGALIYLSNTSDTSKMSSLRAGGSVPYACVHPRPPLLDASLCAGALQKCMLRMRGAACSGAGAGGRDLATERAVAASLRDIQDYEERARRQAQAASSAAAAAGGGPETYGANGEPANPQGTTLA